ncbi:inward rectifier potassium channel 2 [Diaphorina citri]|uniref:Inward rectifier potassium channel 2 n=1 Tax=Diaphorina citri TaxID=121845 RepID=A0A3Q0J8H4_DIACI|nr:inward rectifier potassium channel 2 [Diaphorina citri]
MRPILPIEEVDTEEEFTEEEEGECFFSVQNLSWNEGGDTNAMFQNLESPISENSAGKVYSSKPTSSNNYTLRRLVSKTGSCRVSKLNSSQHLPLFTAASDTFTSLIECRWRWVWTIFTLSFVLTWLLFAVGWWIIAYHHGDLKTSPVRFSISAPSSKPTSSNNYTLRRLVSKTGSCRVSKLNSSQHLPLFTAASDTFTSLIECRWRWVWTIFTLSFVLTWLLFAVGWWIIAYHHGDLKTSPVRDPFNDTLPCVTGVDDFITSFLFSMETQYSTGYGSRIPNTHCPEAIFLVSIQSIFGVLINALTGGIIFAKLAKPKKRSQNLLFSDKAVICQRDGEYRLIWRIGDLRKSHLIGAKLRAWFLCRRMTREGEMIPRYKYKLNITVDDGG